MRFFNPLRAWLLPVFVAFLFVGCEDNNPTPSPENKVLVGSTLKAQFTKAELSRRLGAINPAYALFLQFGVKVHVITYKTQLPDGTAVTASGAILVPDSPNPLPVVSQQHGTITDDAQAPSNYGPGSDAYEAATVFASTGYIMVCPDYIGYGASKSVPHTYEHRLGLAQASLDMLRAAKEFIANNNINWDKRVYLTGYSEGGYATMALFKLMEEKYPDEFNIRAVSAGAGAYNKTAFMKQIVNGNTSGEAEYNRLYVWVLRTYNDLYKLARPMSFYFKEPYATEAQKGLNANISVSLDKTFTDSFKKAVSEGSDADFTKAVADNDVFDWKPKAPLRLYHGDADQLVLFLNSKTAFDAMKARGATNVELIPIEKATHATGISGYVLGTFDMFSTVK